MYIVPPFQLKSRSDWSSEYKNQWDEMSNGGSGTKSDNYKNSFQHTYKYKEFIFLYNFPLFLKDCLASYLPFL